MEQWLGLWRPQAGAAPRAADRHGLGDAAAYAKRGYDEAMRVQMVVGMMNYCGIARADLEILYDVMAATDARAALLARAGELGEGFFG